MHLYTGALLLLHIGAWLLLHDAGASLLLHVGASLLLHTSAIGTTLLLRCRIHTSPTSSTCSSSTNLLPL
jgi:hypothetical protein